MKKSEPQNKEVFTPIAITGIGCIFPRSKGAREYWRTLFNGIDCIGEVPDSHWSPSDYYDEDPQKPDHVYCKRGGFIDPVSYDPAEFGIPPAILEATDTSQLLGLVAAKMALNDAGYGDKAKDFDRARTSVVLGATGTQELTVPLATRLGHPVWRRALEESGLPSEKTEEVIKRISSGFVSWQENSFPGLLGNVIAGRIANRLDLGGTNCVVDAACGSSLAAIHLALLELVSGRSDMAITGGVDLLNDIFMHMCFSKTGVLSKSGDAKPFSEDADGTVLGEGIGMLTLKRLEDAERDNDRIYAVIRGAGSSSDGKSQSIYAPSAKGQEKALRKAYEMAAYSPSTVELVEAHGTGTRVGDAVEFNALRHVFSGHGKGQEKNRTALGSVKSMIGHTKAAAGAAGMIKTALAIYNKVIPPTLKITTPDPKLEIEKSPFYLPSVSFPWFSDEKHPRRAGVSAFGFGGSNFHMTLEEYGKDKKEPSWDGSVEIFAFSADTREEVLKSFEKASSAVFKDAKMTAITAYESRKSFDSGRQIRLLFSCLHDSAPEMFEKTKAMLESGENDYVSRSGSAFYREGKKSGKIGFIFPGQGSQYTGMARELSCIFPEMMDSIEKAASVFKGDRKLHEYVYPRSGDEEANETELRNTSVAQPAIGAVSLGFMRILERFGVKPESVCGHSYGELTALACSGIISKEDFFRLSVLRGRFMAEAGKGGDAGTMLAVKGRLEDIEAMIKETDVDVVLANRNSHDQGVLSGSADAIEQAKQLCKERKMRGTQLNVAAAFHSRFVASAAVPFSKELESVEFRPSDIPVFANTTAEPYPSSVEESRHLLGNQLVNSVKFVEIIEAMHDSGVSTFIEAGPKTVLTGLVKSILKGKAFECVATDDSSGKKSGLLDMATILCRLSALGHRVLLEHWEVVPSSPRKPKMNIPIAGTNYRNPEKVIKVPVSPRFVIAGAENAIKKSGDQIKEISVNRVQTAETKNVALESEKTHKTTIPNSKIEKSVRQKEIDDRRPNLPENPGLTGAEAAIRSINEGFKAMQVLQMQTTDAHKKFLETQMQASRTLESLMQKVGDISGLSTNASISYAQSPVQQVRPSADIEKTVEQAHMVKKQAQEISTHISSVTSKEETARQPEKKIQETGTSAAKASVVSEKLEESVSNIKDDSISGISEVLLAVVSDLTGYPVEMLDLDMDIESDLGIDSIKRVEILSAFEERMPGAGNVDPADLGSLKTLGQIIDYVSARSKKVSDSATSGAKSSSSGIKQASFDTSIVKAILIEVVSSLTGYPEEMLDLDMDIESDLGIDSIKRVEILSAFEEKMPGAGNVDPSDIGKLKTLAQIVSYICERSSADPKSAPAASESVSKPVIESASTDDIKVVLIDVVSSLTGYPSEMLDLDMDIESDLGIDSIKRVEILSAFEERMPGTATVDPSDLGRLKTLGQIIDYISSSSAGSANEKSGSSDSVYDIAKIKTALLDVVSSLTGYPSEMLDLDMDIESDLGIDSIKRVEILSAFEEKMPGIPQVQPDDLGKLKTLGQIIDHISSQSSGIGLNNEKNGISTIKSSNESLQGSDSAIVTSEPGMVPQDIMRKTVSVCRVDGSLKGEMISLPESGTIYITGHLEGLGHETAATLSAMDVRVKTISIDEITDDSINLPDDLSGLVIIAPDAVSSDPWKGNGYDFVKKSFLVAKRAASALNSSGRSGGAVLAAVSRLDGSFGFLSSNVSDPFQGALPGLVKTARIEWPEVSCRAFDITPFIADIKSAASALAEEIMSKGPVETGLDCHLKDSVIKYDLVLEDSQFMAPEKKLGKNDVVVITGGARGVTAACAEELASFCQPVMILLGRSPEPEVEPAWLSGIDGEAAMKKAILENEFKNKKATPQQLEKSYRKIKASREIAGTIESIRINGSRAFYYQVDVRNHSDMEKVIEKVRANFGAISAIIHGAGVLEDRFIADKTLDQFENVFGTKIDGLRNLLDATRNDPLKAIVLFSSVSARMGNKGQVDYSMANEVLNKTAVFEASRRPGCRVVSINWGPWDGGMVNPLLKKEFNRQGVELIPLRSGAKALVSEMCSSHSGCVEVVVGGEFNHGEPKPFRKEIISKTNDSGILVKVGVNEIPFLNDHVIGGKAVVPVALMAEWFAHAALISNPGLVFNGLENLRVLNGIKLGNDEVEVRISGSKPVKNDGLFRTDLEIRSRSEKGSEKLHARATAVLGNSRTKLSGPKNVKPVHSDDEVLLNTSDMYEKILFHGSSLHGVYEISGLSEKGITARATTAPSPSEWIKSPLRKKWVADPLVLDSAFQLASAWCYMNYGKVSLPSFAGQYAQYVDRFPAESVEIAMNMRSVSGSRMTADFMFSSQTGDVIAEIRGFESVMDLSLNQAFKNGGISLKIAVPADVN